MNYCGNNFKSQEGKAFDHLGVMCTFGLWTFNLGQVSMSEPWNAGQNTPCVWTNTSFGFSTVQLSI